MSETVPSTLDPQTIKVVKIQERRFGLPIYPWRTRKLGIGEERNIIAVTDRADKYGSQTPEKSAVVRTNIRVVGRNRIQVAKEIRPFGQPDFTPTNEGLREFTLGPNEPTVIEIGWARTAKVYLL